MRAHARVRSFSSRLFWGAYLATSLFVLTLARACVFVLAMLCDRRVSMRTRANARVFVAVVLGGVFGNIAFRVDVCACARFRFGCFGGLICMATFFFILTRARACARMGARVFASVLLGGADLATLLFALDDFQRFLLISTDF